MSNLLARFLAASLMVSVPFSLVGSGAARGQDRPQGTPQSPTGTPPTDAPRSEPNGSGSSRPSVGVGVQIDVGQVIGGLDKLRKAREERRRARRQAAADAEAAAGTSTLPVPAEIAPKPIASSENSAAAQPTVSTPAANASDPKPVVMFSPTSKRDTKPVLVPAAVPVPVAVRVPVAQPKIVPDAPAPAVSKSKTANAPIAVVSAQNKPRQEVAKTQVPLKRAVEATPQITPPVPTPDIVLPQAEIVVTAPPAIAVDVQPSLAVAPVVAAVPEKSGISALLLGLIGAAILALVAFFGLVAKPKAKPAGHKSSNNDRPKGQITGQASSDTDPKSVLTFDDGKDLLPAVLTGSGQTSSTLVFDDPAAAA